jgi:hypothetical protein
MEETMARPNASPWHIEYYDKALHQMAAHALDKVTEGWLDFLRTKYPEQYKKYEAAMQVIIDLWGNPAPTAMEAWKRAVKVEVDATKWALDRFNEEHVTGTNVDLGECKEIIISWESKGEAVHA